MKSFLFGVLVAIAIAAAAGLLLEQNQQLAYEAYATSGARVSDPGYNLVGPTWSGEPTVNAPKPRS